MDCLCYSFPCQGLSKANTTKKKGLIRKDSHSSVLWSLKEQIERLRPEWLIMENVDQIHNKNYGPDSQVWINTLESLGYTSKWKDLRISDFGVPQDRVRCFMLSHLGADCPDLPDGTYPAPPLSTILEGGYIEEYEVSKSFRKKMMYGG